MVTEAFVKSDEVSFEANLGPKTVKSILDKDNFERIHVMALPDPSCGVSTCPDLVDCVGMNFHEEELLGLPRRRNRKSSHKKAEPMTKGKATEPKSSLMGRSEEVASSLTPKPNLSSMRRLREAELNSTAKATLAKKREENQITKSKLQATNDVHPDEVRMEVIGSKPCFAKRSKEVGPSSTSGIYMVEVKEEVAKELVQLGIMVSHSKDLGTAFAKLTVAIRSGLGMNFHEEELLGLPRRRNRKSSHKKAEPMTKGKATEPKSSLMGRSEEVASSLTPKPNLSSMRRLREAELNSTAKATLAKKREENQITKSKLQATNDVHPDEVRMEVIGSKPCFAKRSKEVGPSSTSGIYMVEVKEEVAKELVQLGIMVSHSKDLGTAFAKLTVAIRSGLG
ncbi:hypothetical protein COCNU_scaffold051542G000010 [Cocos nucifera]|nr:hypothetical protein [Cocos nucifera]